jgi:hypothetical protein
MYKKRENKAKKAKIRAPTGYDPRTSGSKIRRLTDCAKKALRWTCSANFEPTAILFL